IRSKRPPIALVGAGASVASGYPAWTKLLEFLKTEAQKEKGAKPWRKNPEDLSDAPWTAEVFADVLGLGGLARVVSQVFSSRQSLGGPHLSLARMPFPHYLTTNFDPSIEEALTHAGRKWDPIHWKDNNAVSDFLINLGHPD